MYREWLEELLKGTPRGTKARLAEHLNLSSDVVSKVLSGVRDITADEMRKVSGFFGAMPPGFEALYPSSSDLIKSDDEILAVLNRIDGLGERGVELTMMTIQVAKAAAKEQTPSQPSADDQSATPTPRHESQSSR